MTTLVERQHSADLTTTSESDALNPTLALITEKLQRRVLLTNNDLEDAVKFLLDENVHELNLMLKQRDYPHAVLNTACQIAMQLEKINFVALLLRHGATPSPTKLVHKMTRFCEHPTFQQYLSGWTKKNWMASDPELNSMEWHCDYTNEKEVVKALIEEAKEYSGDTKCALKVFFKAINVCMKYHLHDESTLILKNDIFCKSILYAIEQDKKGLVARCRNFSSDFSSRMLTEILARPESKRIHLEFLIGEVWKDKNLDISASKVSIRQLIVQKSIRNDGLIKTCLKFGLPLMKDDIVVAIHEFPIEQQQLIKQLALKLEHSKEDLDSLCEVAVSTRKAPFVITFVQLGASLPSTKVHQDTIEDTLKTFLQQKDYDGARALIEKFTKTIAENFDLASLMDSNIVKFPALIEMLIDKGLNPNGRGRKTPIGVVMSNQHLERSKRIEIMCVLLKSGEDCRHLCLTSKLSATPLHVATEKALETGGDMRLVNAVISSSTFDPNAEMLNDKKETPLHLAVKTQWKKDLSTKVLSALLEINLINPLIKDQHGKRPIDYLSKRDSRYNMLDAVMVKPKPELLPQKKKVSKKKIKGKRSNSQTKKLDAFIDQNSTLNATDTSNARSTPSDCTKPEAEGRLHYPIQVEETRVTVGEIISTELQSEIESSPFLGYESLSSNEKLDYLVKTLIEKAPVPLQSAEQDHTDHELVVLNSPTQDDAHNGEQQSNLRAEDQSDDVVVKVKEKPDYKQEVTKVSDRFDELPWEVEVTPKVVGFFKDIKKNSYHNRLAAARTICKLAEGMRNEHLSKRVSTEKSLHLFEARMTQGARILWEEAISYSAKLTGHNNPVYTGVIRVWEIVLSHDNLDRRIKYCKEQIEKSHRRGSEASLNFKWFLMPQKQAYNGDGTIPDRFIPTQEDCALSEHCFIPAASTKDDQYNVTTFHSFDTSTVKSLLLGTNDRMDFPFKEWQKEHEIIRLCTEEAILLLGRSGTGKTTCCLYRLWNEFNGFWNPDLNKACLKIPRKCLIPPSIVKDKSAADDNSQEKTVAVTELDDSENDLKAESKLFNNEVSNECLTQTKDLLSCEDNTADMDSTERVACASPTVSASHDVVTEEEPSASCLKKAEIEENLHQVFITKNRVLCDYMKKSFYNMAAAHDFLESHMKYENTELPNSLSQIRDEAFPLFLTARQFFVLLDNSLGDITTSTYIPRDKDGNIDVKITSTDYSDDYRKMVLRLQENRATISSTKQWIEVTALYFKDHIWKKISHQHTENGKQFEPMLVWTEIQSFIKGSECALRKGEPLSCEEYKDLGDRMAPSFADCRDAVYDIFLKYQKYRQGKRHIVILYDECDLILDIYNRLKHAQDIPWSIHSLYIDEVQDFTQAELSILVHCTRDVNSIFFTGDTAQTIMRGISFRFQDIRSLFYNISVSTKGSPKVNVPQKPYNLKINFRSHSGILGLAGSIIDLITEFFKDSIDQLPNDVSMLPGPIPVVVESCKVKDLALLLRANKREASAIEFGAHQVILVQSQQARENLPQILKGAMVFTIFEAKGLEFDDVLLYNFFTDSTVDEKGWRVVSSYLEMSQHCMKVTNTTSMWDTRSCQFLPNLNKSLNDELKRLYTAITRTKSNLWIYDSNQNLRLPMFNYWYKRNLVKVVNTQGNDDHIFDVVFAANSAPEQWKAQGDNLMEKRHFEQALHCYQRAGKENEYLVKKADAYCLLQRALNLPESSELRLKAAIKFLETAEYCVRNNSLDCMTSVELLNSAAMCLWTSQPPRFIPAAQLFEHVGKEEEALRMYFEAKDITNYVRIKERLGQHSEVVQTLWNKPFLRKRDALAKAKSYEEENIQLQPEWSVSELAYSCAKFYLKRKDTHTLIEVLQYLPQVSKRVKFLKDAKLYAEAFDILVKQNQFEEACRLASAQGGYTDITSIDNCKSWLNNGLQIATQNNDDATRASFVFQLAILEYYLKTEGKLEKVSVDLIDKLKSLQSSKSYHIKAQAHLLFGMFKKKASHCNSALTLYHDEKHYIGELEAFHQLQQFDNHKYLTDQLLLNVCHLSNEISQALKTATSVSKELTDAISFYGMQRIGSYYYIPPGQNIWIKDLLMNCVCRSNNSKVDDPDGMVKLDDSKVKTELVRHCKMFKFSWLARHQLQKRLEQKLTLFTLHEQLWTDQIFNCTCPDSKVCTENMQKYLQTSVHMLELQCLKDHDNQLNIEQNIAMLIAVFTPRVSIFVQTPHQLTAEHISIIRQSVNSQKSIEQYISDSILNTTVQYAECVQLEPWIMAWRACCISDPDMKVIFGILQNLEKLENDASSSSPGFIFWRSNQQHYHIFSIWLNSCAEIREHGKPLWAARLAIKHFLGNVDAKHNIDSTMDVVYLLSVHCTSLLGILTHVDALYGYAANYRVPLIYEKIVNSFDLMNTWKGEQHCLLPACGTNVRRRKNYFKVLDDCYSLLVEILHILLGTHKMQGYLELNLKDNPSANGTRYCLILVLVILGNIKVNPSLKSYQIKHFIEKLQSLIRTCLDKTEVPHFILEVEGTIKALDIPTLPSVFTLVTKLLDDAKVDSTLAEMSIHSQSDCLRIEPLSLISSQPEFSNQDGTQSQPKQESSIPQRTFQTPQSHIPGPGWTSHNIMPVNYSAVQAVQMPPPQVVPLRPITLQPNMTLHHSTLQPNVLLHVTGMVPPHHRQVPPQVDFASNSPTLPYYSYDQVPVLQLSQHNEVPLKRKYTESDDVDEEEIKLTAGVSSEPFINPNVLDSERIIVTDKYCNACGVNLVNTESSESTESKSEEYYAHLLGQVHLENYNQFTIFSSQKDEGRFKQVLQELNNLREKCLEAKQAYDTAELDLIVDGIQEEMDESTKTISSHENHRSWKEGSKAIYRMEESLSKRLQDYSESYAKVSEDLKTRHQNEEIDSDVLTQDLQELERCTEKYDPIDAV